ncbi:hypothetical protein JCM3766R1_002645 [Sporobolomyces carnicolor]
MSHARRPVELDFSSFAGIHDDDDSDDHDDDDDDDEPSATRHPRRQDDTIAPVVPGGYDFEPRACEGGRRGGASTSTSSSSDGPTPRSNWRDLWTFSRRTTTSSEPPFAASSSSRDESNRLLFNHDDDDDRDDDDRQVSDETYPPPRHYPRRDIHLPLPARPPAFAPPTSSSSTSTANNDIDDPTRSTLIAATASSGARVYGGGASNDGVFSNLAAKPDGSARGGAGGGRDIVGEGPSDKDEVLPAYEAAALDQTPPYWDTTVITPGGGPFGTGGGGADDICVDGMPVGNLFSFAWNLLVSMSFQFVGFLLTYLLHTTHAAKNGSRAGLGITLIQLGFYLKQHTDHGAPPLFDDPSTASSRDDDNNVKWSWWGGGEIEDSSGGGGGGALPTQQISNTLLSGIDQQSRNSTTTGLPSLMGTGGATEQELNEMSLATNEWISFALVTVGSFLVIGGCLSYWRAVRYARAMRRGQGPGQDSENMAA